ncbi:hydrolase [Lithospermum erythrorhizon]|uniref:Hydrolase n=1 Tax=Lithospermum erythrorhizon TaxID=34254 RepID=A0AAV3PC11_LITER
MAEVVVERPERRILVAVDESEESSYALSWCLENIVSSSSQNKDSLILLYAKPPRTLYPTLDGTGAAAGYILSSDVMESMERYNNEVAASVLDKAKRECSSVLNNDEIKVETMAEYGDPRDVICQVAERMNVDVVVMGSHGYGLIQRTFLGSVSNHCAQNLKCPVLIVKKPKSNGGN